MSVSCCFRAQIPPTRCTDRQNLFQNRTQFLWLIHVKAMLKSIAVWFYFFNHLFFDSFSIWSAVHTMDSALELQRHNKKRKTCWRFLCTCGNIACYCHCLYSSTNTKIFQGQKSHLAFTETNSQFCNLLVTHCREHLVRQRLLLLTLLSYADTFHWLILIYKQCPFYKSSLWDVGNVCIRLYCNFISSKLQDLCTVGFIFR